MTKMSREELKGELFMIKLEEDRQRERPDPLESTTDYLRRRPAKNAPVPSKIQLKDVGLVLALCFFCGWTMLGIAILWSAPGPMELLMGTLIMVPLEAATLSMIWFIYR